VNVTFDSDERGIEVLGIGVAATPLAWVVCAKYAGHERFARTRCD